MYLVDIDSVDKNLRREIRVNNYRTDWDMLRGGKYSTQVVYLKVFRISLVKNLEVIKITHLR